MSTRWTSRARFHLLRSAGYREGNSAERSNRPNPSGPHGGHPTLLDREGPGTLCFPWASMARPFFGADVAGPVFYNAMKFTLQTLQIPPQPGLVAPYVRLNAR